MAAKGEAKVAYLGSPWFDFNNCGVYCGVFKVSELIALVFKMIVRQGHSQKVILMVNFKENVSLEGFPLFHTILKWIDCKLYAFTKYQQLNFH